MNSSIFSVPLLLPLASCLGCLFLLKSAAKLSKKYQAFVTKLRKQSKYEEWVEEHKVLAFLENIYRYLGISVILFVLVGFIIEFVAVPQNVLLIVEILAYLYWPMMLIILLMIVRLSKEVPELNG